jgi:hypothetical protein
MSLSDNDFLSFHVGRPLWREDGSVIFSAVTHRVKSHRTHNHMLLSHLRLPNLEVQVPFPISPMNRVVQPKVKVKSRSQVSVGRNLYCYYWEGCMWNMQCNMEFGYQLSICSGTKENLDRVIRLQDRPVTNWLLASSPSGNIYASSNISPYLCCWFLSFILLFPHKFFYKYFYVRIIWIGTKPCITHAEGMNAYMNKCAYKYTYICICDSLIIGEFGSRYTRFVAHPITKIMFYS